MIGLNEDKEENLKAAANAMMAARPLRAEEICRNWLDGHPGSVEHMRLLGHALMKQNRLPEAEEQVRFALELRPRQPQLHEDLGSILALQGKLEDSVPCFEKAIELQPNLPLAHKKLGRALAALGRGQEADEAFMEYFDRDPGAGEVALGADHLKAGRAEEAIKVLRAALRQNPDNVDAMCFLALAYPKPMVAGYVDPGTAATGRLTQWIGPGHDAISGATPLGLAKQGAWQDVALLDMFIGRVAGSAAQTCTLAILIGGVLLFRDADLARAARNLLILTEGFPTYYLVDTDGDGKVDRRQSRWAERFVIPQWVLFRW